MPGGRFVALKSLVQVRERHALDAPNGLGIMLVCSCNVITLSEIEDTIREMLDEDPWQLIVPAKVLHTMNSRGRCCGCFPNLVETIIRVTEAYHRDTGAREADVIAYLDKVRELRNKFGSKFNERRYKGHRAA